MSGLESARDLFRKEPLSGYRILVVDDEEDARTLLLTVLADAGAQTFEASDGAEAIAAAKRHRPDLITLDLEMPRHDGVAAFCELRNTPILERIPICVVTGHPELRALIYNRPAPPPEGFIQKPIDPEWLVKTLRRILELKARGVR